MNDGISFKKEEGVKDDGKQETKNVGIFLIK